MEENYILNSNELRQRLRIAAEENWKIKILVETSRDENIFSLLQKWPKELKKELFLFLKIEEKNGKFYNKSQKYMK